MVHTCAGVDEYSVRADNNRMCNSRGRVITDTSSLSNCICKVAIRYKVAMWLLPTARATTKGYYCAISSVLRLRSTVPVAPAATALAQRGEIDAYLFIRFSHRWCRLSG